MRTITEENVRCSVADAVKDLVDEYKGDHETTRETLIEALDEACDNLFGSLVQHGRIDQYDADDLVFTAQPCAMIVKVAKEDAWIEDDSGLWQGLTFGVLASIAYFSLRNLFYKGMADAGHDSNEEHPFARAE